MERALTAGGMKRTPTPEQSRRLEVDRALRQLACGRDASQVLETLSRRLTNKLLHPPTRALREKGSTCTSTS